MFQKPTRSEWSAALARWQTADAAYNEFEATRPVMAGDGPVERALDDEWTMLGADIAEAANDLLDIPAPNLSALRWKLDYLLDGEPDGCCWGKEALRQTVADYRRLIP